MLNGLLLSTCVSEMIFLLHEIKGAIAGVLGVAFDEEVECNRFEKMLLDKDIRKSQNVIILVLSRIVVKIDY